MLAALFWFSAGFVFYAYVGYPLLLKGIVLFRKRPILKGTIVPSVSLIITAFNEERRLAAKLENTLKVHYPREKLEIIVASDCSEDRTDEIVRSYGAQGVKLIRSSERRGKENAQRLAVENAGGEILVFSDVATVLDPDGLTRIVQGFNDPTVGCVSSVDRFIDPDGRISGEGVYVRYEMFLRNLESQVNSVVGLSGSFFAARREACRPWPTDVQSDFNIVLNARKLGLRGVSDLESVGYYKNIADERKEFERKVRTVLRGIAVLMKNRSFLNPFQYGLFSWQLFSHKLCRWLVPFFLITAFVSNALLVSRSGAYKAAFGFQLMFYGVAFGKMIRKSFPDSRFMKIPFYFVMVNLSILSAWYRYVRGERMVSWNPSER